MSLSAVTRRMPIEETTSPLVLSCSLLREIPHLDTLAQRNLPEEGYRYLPVTLVFQNRERNWYVLACDKSKTGTLFFGYVEYRLPKQEIHSDFYFFTLNEIQALGAWWGMDIKSRNKYPLNTLKG